MTRGTNQEVRKAVNVIALALTGAPADHLGDWTHSPLCPPRVCTHPSRADIELVRLVLALCACDYLKGVFDLPNSFG